MKAIVTGANGFIGKRLCKALILRGYKVICIVRNKHSIIGNFDNLDQVSIYECSLGNYYKLTEYEDLYDADVFFHLAWEGAYGNVLCNEDVQNLNIGFSCQAIKVAKELKTKKFIFAGTINELELVEYLKSEVKVPREKSIYGIVKLTCDLELKTIASRVGINYNTAIIGSSFGPGDMSLRIHNAFMLSLLKNEQPRLVACENLHDWVYVDEIANMFVAIGLKSKNLKNYYLGHNCLRKLKDILLDVKNIINPKLNISFGNIPGDLYVDYSLVDINSLYDDTDYVSNDNFNDEILITSKWLKENRL